MVQDSKSDKAVIKEIHLNTLLNETPGITRAVGETFAEAAAVCLEDQRHRSRTAMNVDGDFTGTFSIAWEGTTAQMRRCWADLQFATEFGAYAIAVLLVHELTELTIVERARKGTGFDFWLGDKDDSGILFQGKGRLEVSGILSGEETIVRSRVRQKLGQTNRSDGKLPALIIVVEFSKPRSRVVNKWKK